MRYRIVLHRPDEGFAVSVPRLPGCWSQGATEDEAIANVRDAGLRVDEFRALL